MKLKELKSKLTDVQSFEKPKIKLEQYITPADIAAQMVHIIHSSYNDILNKDILDLCSGTGMLSVASSFYFPSLIICVDKCYESLKIAKENFKNFNISNYTMIHADISELKMFNYKFDVTIMNPPFGTKIQHMDVVALDAALSVSKVVYSLHKTSTRKYLLKKYNNIEILAEIKYELNRTYSFHKKDKKYIEVDFIRVCKN